jgi:hypothetical protein
MNINNQNNKILNNQNNKIVNNQNNKIVNNENNGSKSPITMKMKKNQQNNNQNVQN